MLLAEVCYDGIALVFVKDKIVLNKTFDLSLQCPYFRLSPIQTFSFPFFYLN
jgi:hypothetical protein